MINEDKMYKKKSGEPQLKGADHNDEWFCRYKRTSITMGWVLFTVQVISGYAEIQATSITNAYGRNKRTSVFRGWS